MGCGKSKHDVASGNTVLQRKKSTVNSKENNETQTVDKNNDANVDNVSLEVEEKNKENVKEIGVEGKGGDESNDVAGITKVQQEDKALEKSAQAEAEENEAPEEVKAVAVAEEKQPTEENKYEVDVSIKEETLPLVKEEESKDTDEEALVKEEESIGTKEETLDKEEETKETTEQEKTLVKEGETKGPPRRRFRTNFPPKRKRRRPPPPPAANHEIEDDDEELEAVARYVSSDDDDNSPDEAAEDDDEDKQDESNVDPEVSKREKARLREMQQLKKQKVQEILDAQNATIDADMNNRGKGRLNYLLQQTELFAHFAKGDQSSQKKAKGRGRHASKVTEEEEDEEYLKGEEDGLANTRLVTQPSCIQGKMRDYQLAGLNWLIRLYENGINGILADEMGLGKTLQTISLLGYLHEFRGITGPHMVVAPKSTLGNWMNEIRRFCPVLRAIKFLGNPDERKHIREELLVAGKFDVCVTSFEMVIKEKSALRRFSWRYIIIDEAHRIKNENSLLSKTMRLYNTNYRLLITGTPLQNNLHELWALLNFLLPEIFSSAETFDEWFQISGENDEHEVVQQLHKVLRPFLLRRLKSDVEKGLPPKKETILKVGMSQMQKQYYKALLQKDLEVVNAGGERKRLLNIAMQLRKCCNHPYLFQGAEPGPPFTTGDHLITNAGKMVLLDKLLPKLKERDSRVLIFSQMTRLLDILEDYLMFCGYQYCRIDGNTGGDDRDASIEAFNKPGSEKFVFLLSTRAGGLGINLATADVVILYDSDWHVVLPSYLLFVSMSHIMVITQYTIEEKVIERAYKKLALDALVIQQGRLAEQKTVNKDELLQMVRFGAEMVFSSKDSTITDEDIDRIIAKGEEATAELDAKMKKFTEDAIKFKMDDTAELYDFDDEKEENKFDFKKIVSENWVEPPRRERKRNYSESEYFKQTMRQGGLTKPKEPRIPRMPQLHDFQFFNTHRLSELYEKEVRYLMQTHQKNQVKDSIDVDEPEEMGVPLTAEELEEKEQLLEEGFSSWSRKDFNAFIRACEKYGRNDIKGIASEMEGKTQEEVERYAKVFKERYKELNDYDRIIKNIERGEARISRKDEIMKAIGKKLDRYRNPWLELKIQYGQNKGKLYNEECDRFMICMIHKLGYGNWDELKAAFRMSPLFRFDWFVKSRTTQEITRRCDTLVRLVEKENQEYDERERQARKEKKIAAKSMTPSKRSMPRQSESPSLKKRKQLTMDDYLSSGKKKK
ncbi:Putative chromatin-remodeling complex ATPase chain [Glycine soja]|nr:Putative chromatin-remodeling complex ATPase chain [Glycine soja]